MVVVIIFLFFVGYRCGGDCVDFFLGLIGVVGMFADIFFFFLLGS